MASKTIKLTGILTDVFPVETRPNFSKQVFWLKEPDTERYPQHWEIELHNEDIRRMTFESGDVLEVEVEIRGRKWEKPGRRESIFMSLKCVGLKRTVAIGKVSGYTPMKKGDRDADPNAHDAEQELPF